MIFHGLENTSQLLFMNSSSLEVATEISECNSVAGIA